MHPPLTIDVRRVSVEAIIDLRHRVLRAGLPRNAAAFPGDNDPASVHVAAFRDTDLVGCATLHFSSYESRPAFQLRGMAVAPDYQRLGVGRLLLWEMERAAIDAGVPVLWANCRTPAVPFYRKLNWKTVSDEFEIETAGPHFKMVKRLKRATGA